MPSKLAVTWRFVGSHGQDSEELFAQSLKRVPEIFEVEVDVTANTYAEAKL